MRFTIPFAGKPKARPRVTSKGQTYMPHSYVEWKHKIAAWVIAHPRLPRYDGPVSIEVEFDRDEVEISILPSEIVRHGRSDIDNLAGGILDALQDAGVITNDRNVVEVIARFRGGTQ